MTPTNGPGRRDPGPGDGALYSAGGCPGCGRFVGPKARRPHCGAAMRMRSSLRAQRWGSVAVAVLGLLFLSLSACRREVPATRTGGLTETRNKGELEPEQPAKSAPKRAPPEAKAEPEGGGENEGEPPGEETPGPETGDGEKPPSGDALKPGMVTRDLKGRTVVVEGTVDKATRQRSGRRVVLTEGGATLVVFVRNSVAKGIPGLASLDKGARIRVRGVVEEHRGTLEVLPAEAGDFSVLEHSSPGAEEGKAPEKRTASSLAMADVGNVVVLEGKIVSVQAIPEGAKAFLDDGSGTVAAVVISDSVKRKLKDPGVVAPGKKVRVAGKVGEVEGELRVVPEEGWDVTGLD